jgi:NAD(P)-dependent dehydrogenase (short-subunit alcohol dehydrogenase family)
VACARRPDAAAELVRMRHEVGARLYLAALDVSAPADADRVASEVSTLGPIHLLINNAGVDRAPGGGAGAVGPLGTVDGDELMEVLRINAVGPVVVTQAFAPQLASDGTAVVVNTTSRLGSLGIAAGADPYAPSYGYRMSKAALNMATIHLARDLADAGVVVVAMSPGYVRTDMTSPAADIDPAESVAGQLATALSLGRADTGTYRGHTGVVIPW